MCFERASRRRRRRPRPRSFLKRWPADPTQFIRLTDADAMVSRATTCKVFLFALLAMSAIDLTEGEPEPRRRSRGDGKRSRNRYIIFHWGKWLGVWRRTFTIMGTKKPLSMQMSQKKILIFLLPSSGQICQHHFPDTDTYTVFPNPSYSYLFQEEDPYNDGRGPRRFYSRKTPSKRGER